MKVVADVGWDWNKRNNRRVDPERSVPKISMSVIECSSIVHLLLSYKSGCPSITSSKAGFKNKAESSRREISDCVTLKYFRQYLFRTYSHQIEREKGGGRGRGGRGGGKGKGRKGKEGRRECSSINCSFFRDSLCTREWGNHSSLPILLSYYRLLASERNRHHVC